MVNNILDSYADTNKQVHHLKETRIQAFQIRSINQADQLKTSKLVERNEKSDHQLNSIENTNLLNESLTCEQSKRTKLNDDLKLFDFIIDKEELAVLSSYLANEVTNNGENLPKDNQLNGNQLKVNQLNENQFLNCTPLSPEVGQPTLSTGALIDEFENSIELNESDCDNNQLSNCTLTNQATNLQNDPFLSFLPYHHFTVPPTAKSTQQQLINSSNSHTKSTNQSSNLTKMLFANEDTKHSHNCPNKQPEMRTTIDDQSTLDNQADLFQQFNNHNSPSDYIKLDPEIEPMKSGNSTSATMNASPIEPVDSIISEKRLNSSQKLNGEDLLFSLTSEDLNEVANYFPLLGGDLSKEKFNCSPSLDSLNSSDSMFCSSVWDSPPPSSTSSNNSNLNNELDLPFILSADSNDLSNKQANEREDFLDSEFPFLSEDSIFDSFVNSNFNDLINTDEFFNEKCTLNDDLQFENNNLSEFLNACSGSNFSNFNNFNNFNNLNSFNSFTSDHATLPKTRKPHCTLSKDSNLAKLLLLKEKLPIKLPSQSSNQTNKASNDFQTDCVAKNRKNDSSIVNKTVNSNQTNQTKQTNSTNSSTVNSTLSSIVNNLTSATKEVDHLRKNGLIARKFTIQGLNTTDKLSTGCLARSIKIIDPVGVQVASGTNGNVKYVVNNLNNLTPHNSQTTANSFSLSIPAANCLTVTTNPTSTSLTTNSNSVSGQLTSTANMSTTKSFIIKSVDGKFANGILYTPIARNGQTTNIAYASNLSANNLANGSMNALTVNSNCTGDSKTKLMSAFPANNLFINNRKLVQKRPFSSMSVSISNAAATNTNIPTKDFYSIDLVPVPKQFTSTNLDDYSSIELSAASEIKKKMRTLDATTSKTTLSTSSTAIKNYSSSKCF